MCKRSFSKTFPEAFINTEQIHYCTLAEPCKKCGSKIAVCEGPLYYSGSPLTCASCGKYLGILRWTEDGFTDVPLNFEEPDV